MFHLPISIGLVFAAVAFGCGFFLCGFGIGMAYQHRHATHTRPALHEALSSHWGPSRQHVSSGRHRRQAAPPTPTSEPPAGRHAAPAVEDQGAVDRRLLERVLAGLRTLPDHPTQPSTKA